MSSHSASRVFPYPDAAGFLWQVAENNLGTFLQEGEDTFSHGQKTSHANYSRLAIHVLTCPQCTPKQEILSTGVSLVGWLVFTAAQTHTAVSCSSLLKHRTLQPLLQFLRADACVAVWISHIKQLLCWPCVT